MFHFTTEGLQAKVSQTPWDCILTADKRLELNSTAHCKLSSDKNGQGQLST